MLYDFKKRCFTSPWGFGLWARVPLAQGCFDRVALMNCDVNTAKCLFLNDSWGDCISYKFSQTTSNTNISYNFSARVLGGLVFLERSLPVGAFFCVMCSISLVTVALLWEGLNDIFRVQY